MSGLKDYLNVYEFTTTLPGSGKEVKYKGITTNSVKKLLVYEDEDDPIVEEEILDAIIEGAVITDGFDVSKQYILDRYYLFVKIREATKGSYYQFQYTCPECDSQKLITIDLNDLIVNKPDNFDSELKLVNDQIKFKMKYPTREDQKELHKLINKNLTNEQKRVELRLIDIAVYVEEIETPEGKKEVDYEELVDFIGDLPEGELEKIGNWKDNNDFGIKLSHNIECNCGHSKEIPLPLNNFF